MSLQSSENDSQEDAPTRPIFILFVASILSSMLST